MSNIAIKVENLSKIYKLYSNPTDRLKEALNPFRKKYHNDFYALKNINFEVARGETIGIIGKNGSGKSTLLKILTGVLTPTEGNIHTRGKISALLELGTGFNPELTGIENTYFSGALMGYTKEEIDKKMDDIISFADIGEFINQPMKIYSSGMFVRLAFAIAISIDPEILIVDEALAVGDIQFQKKCFSKFESFKNSGKTILFVTHSTELVKTYCDKAVLLNNGEVLETGNPKDVVSTYLRILRNFELKTKIDKTENITEVKKISNDKSLDFIEKSIWYNKNEYKYGTEEAIFTKIGLFDENGCAIKEFEIGSIMTMVVEFKANEDIDELFFGYGIRNIQGQDLIVFNGTPKYDNFGIKNLKKGQSYKIQVKYKINVVPHDYCITLSLAKKGDKEIIQIRYDVLLFKVTGKGRLYAGFFADNADINYEQI